ncbi:hypothetical protein F4553_007655 [Allocatelliglobosispora scoriae]|uniref:Alkaline shock response membrane anchor protein AmaP n=1 Tax=Allocatelliglobosispora scoriae TaxID=643052 RepID=A0A841C5Z3_9ACTN|nr:hypothetical protein [Allocatelliglobosispora scoriae]MBB5874221.1 hypothetical protein [Allocatelliglobosispora scoriae]
MNTGNRVLWILIGLVLTAVGVLGALISLDRLPRTYPDQPLLWPGLLEQWRARQGWATAAVVALGLVAAVLGFWLLRVQLRPQGKRHLPDLVFGEPAQHRPDAAPVAAEPTAAAAGVTEVRYRAIADSLAADLRRQQSVHKASVLLTGHAEAPELRLNLTARPGTDLATLRRGVDTALVRFTTTTGITASSVLVDTRVETPAAVAADTSRVH